MQTHYVILSLLKMEHEHIDPIPVLSQFIFCFVESNFDFVPYANQYQPYFIYLPLKKSSTTTDGGNECRREIVLTSALGMTIVFRLVTLASVGFSVQICRYCHVSTIHN